ncbi:MAG: carboxypeptidase regulatory-like domain-containing protein [Dehalococcoidia bacterium]|nr:MAG: carboxypeptidase regulatory-like domain-containing protein [Dehalococcoidia bacterium]
MRRAFHLMPVITLLLPAVILISGCLGGGPPEPGGIEGTVTDTDHNPVANVTVSIVSGTTGFPEIAAITNEDGYYTIGSIPPGTFDVAIHDQEGNRVGIESIVVQSRQTSTLNFTIATEAVAEEEIPPGPSLPKEAEPSEPQPTPTERWTADGVFGEREYLGEMSYDNYEIRWLADDQYVYIGMKAKTTGWVAVGIKPTLAMKDADTILGFVKDGETTVFDQFSTGATGPHISDTELGGSNDILDLGGSEEGGYTTIEFKRALNTGDEYDNELSPGTNKIIWSYGSTDDLGRKHIARGYGEITL